MDGLDGRQIEGTIEIGAGAENATAADAMRTVTEAVADLTLVLVRAPELVLLTDTDTVPLLVLDLVLATGVTGTALDPVTVGSDEVTGKTVMVAITVAAADLVLLDVVQVGMVRPDRTGRRVSVGL